MNTEEMNSMQESNRKPIELASSELSVISTQTKEKSSVRHGGIHPTKTEIVRRMYVRDLCDPRRRDVRMLGQKEVVNS